MLCHGGCRIRTPAAGLLAKESIQTLGLQSSVYVNIRDTRVLALITRMSAKACFVGDLVARSLNVLC